MITPVRARVATREYDSARINSITNIIKHLNKFNSKITVFALLQQGKLGVPGKDTSFDLSLPIFWILALMGPAGPAADRSGDAADNYRIWFSKKNDWIKDDRALLVPSFVTVSPRSTQSE